jgi:hypothetical protein
MGIKNKRNTKLKLEDIPNVNKPGRALFIEKITKLSEYKEAVESGIPGFLEEELEAIEKKYKEQGGLLQEDIQNELKNKGWQVKPNTIKHYIQVGQVPRPNTRIGKSGKGAVSLYPITFMRHLNLVRFALNAGRNPMSGVIKVLNVMQNDYETLLAHTPNHCFEKTVDGVGGFFFTFLVGLDRIAEGIQASKEAIQAAFKDENEAKAEYLKMVTKIEKRKESLANIVYAFKEKSESQKTMINRALSL